jgi:hypothetical protein
MALGSGFFAVQRPSAPSQGNKWLVKHSNTFKMAIRMTLEVGCDS